MKFLKCGSILVLFVLVLAGCGKTKEARADFEQAKMLYETKQYAAAKSAIDTIRILYPREIEILKESLTLMRLVEKGESERNVAFCDSIAPILAEKAEKLKADFVLEKDSVYEDIGNYIWKQQTIERNVQRSYIRCGVNEKGEIYLASVYFGGRAINHTGLKLSAPDGTFAETASIPYDGGMNYRFTDLGNTTEVVTYKGENCIDAVNFVYGTGDKVRIKVEYIGGTKYSLNLDENDKKAIRATYELAVVLSDLETMRIEKEKSAKKVMYIDEKLKGNEEIDPINKR